MVIRKNIKNRFAFISVYNKKNLKYLCDNLDRNKFKFISTGSTCKKIRSLGHNCLEISKVSKFKEILDGRVKTLNPKIYGSILYKRDNKKHLEEFNNLDFPKIEIVIVNFYPFKKFIDQNNEDNIIEMIDIGGPSLIRAASKNYKYVTAISSINDYSSLVGNLKKNMGITDLNFRKKMASKSFKLISLYDNLISNWFENKDNENFIKLKYGENPDQSAYLDNNIKKSILDYQVSGKEISYNNIIDIDSGLRCLYEFKEPTCIIIKHNNPCGVASSANIETAFKKALNCDTKSAFGGIVLFNRSINSKFASLLKNLFFELIVSPNFDKGALNILTEKKKLILLKINKINIEQNEYKSTLFGKIHQTINSKTINKKFFNLVAGKNISKKTMDDLIFATKVAKHLKSNAIVLTSNKQTIGIGSGFTNRIDALRIALKRKDEKFKDKRFVCASDGFFPFVDSLKLLKKNNCNIVAQPSGSINDTKNITYASEKKISLYFIKNRLFKH